MVSKARLISLLNKSSILRRQQHLGPVRHVVRIPETKPKPTAIQDCTGIDTAGTCILKHGNISDLRENRLSGRCIPLPDMRTLITRLSFRVSKLKQQMIDARRSEHEELEDLLKDLRWPGVLDFSHSGYTPTQCHPEKRNEILQQLWENKLKYDVYFNHVTRNEQWWAGPPRRRLITFEHDVAGLEETYLKQTGKAIEIYAHAYNVELPPDFIEEEIDTIQYAHPFSNLGGDGKAFLIFNSFEIDFLRFAKEFFTNCFPPGTVRYNNVTNKPDVVDT